MDDILKDKRFAHVAKDPRFRKMPAGQRKVKIDDRFKGMFKDKRFKLKYSVDKRGKPLSLTTNENLKKYYELSEDSLDSDENDGNSNDKHGDEGTVAAQIKNKKSKKTKKLSKRKSGKSALTTGRNISDEDEQLSDSDLDIDTEGKDTENSKSKFSNNKDEVGKDNKKKKKATIPKKYDIDDEVDLEQDSEEVSSEEDTDIEKRKKIGNDSGVDFARGEGNIYSSSSDDDDDTGDEDNGNDEKNVSKIDHKWGEKDDTVIDIEEATSRLAVCNMDWDRMKAKDIFVLLNSFKPTNGIIKSVKVYPSEYGKERMAEEVKHGPKELQEMKIDSSDEEDDVANEGTIYHREKLRQYQLNRLKYYYAVIECDCVQTADHIYKECDGLEYESSATKLDLRFIPDGEVFEESEVSSVCSEIPANYKPQFFLNAALSQSKVDLTWDETDRERVQLTSQQFTNNAKDVEEEDLQAYLASSSDEEGEGYGGAFGSIEEDGESGDESDDDKNLDKYKKLLTDINSQETKKKHDVEMEISWEPGLKEATEKIVKKKKQSKDSTVWEDYLQKKKEKKKNKIEERLKKNKKKEAVDEEVSDDEEMQASNDTGEMQAFSDDDLPDADMAAFMADESFDKKKKKKKKKKKGNNDEESTETVQEKAKLSLLMMDESDDKKHFNLRDLVQEDGKKKKKKMKGQKSKTEEDNFEVNVADPRFSAMYDSHFFNIDPSAPEYRKTKGTEALISEKIKRSGKRDRNKTLSREEEQVKKPKLMNNQQTTNEDNLASLIKSVKSKTKHFHGNKTKR